MRFSALIALALTGCVTAQPCPSGTTSVGDVCIAPDANVRDTGVDAGPDAHVACGGACTGATPHCNPATDTCVACLTTPDCETPEASRCNSTFACVGCTDSNDCAHLTNTPVCAAGGTCVECLTNTDCASNEGCDTATNTCVAFTPGSANTCGTCLRDAQCMTGQLCVPLTYDDPTTAAADPVPVGNHCMWRQDATGAGAPNGNCFVNERPYVRASMLTSVDGTSAMMCVLAVSTCEAQAAFRMTDCMTLDAAGDARCGLTDVHDGVCRAVATDTNRCTTFCGSDDDCRPGFTCDGAASPPVCHF